MNGTVAFNRRAFVSGAAACAAVAASASAKTARAAGNEPAWDHEAEVVVVGGGCSGWAATWECVKAGVSTIVIEKNGSFGGDMVVCQGLLPGYDTDYTRSMGVTATADEVWREYLDRGQNPHGLPPQDVTEHNFRTAGENIDFMADCGVQWQRADVQSHYSQYDIFFQCAYDDIIGGAGFLTPMTDYFESCGAELLMNTRAMELVTNEDGRVVGVRCQQDGKDVYVKGTRGVVLCTGAYTSNSKLIGMFAEQWGGVSSCTRPTSTGDGLVMAMALGAVTVRTQDGGFFLGNTVYNTGKNIAADLLYHGMIVSAQGKRCINDGASYANNDLINEFERQFAQQPEDYLWFVCSEEAKEYYDLNNATYGLTDEDYVSGDTLEALAEAMGVNADDLVQAAADVTAGAGELVDPVYGERTSNFPMPTVATGPFHAIKMAPSIVMTTGGLKANLDGVVLRAKGVEVLNDLTPEDTTEIFEAIPGLFAGGEIVEWSCYTGWSCNSCFSLGRLAGAAAAANEPVE